MSYTATTIGFGEIPYPFTYNQRMWVTISIYLTVIGWAYAIGSLLALLQDRAFRSALALQHFSRKVARLREPFVLIAGYGRTGELLGPLVRRARTAVRRPGPRSPSGSTAWSWTRYHADVPGLAADARDPGHLAVAGLGHSSLRGGRGPHRRRGGQPRHRHGGGAAAPRPAGDRAGHVADDRRAHAGVRQPEHGQPVRPVRRPPAPRPAGAGVLPAADLAGERPGRRAARRAARRRAPAAGSSAATAGSAGS